MKKLMAVLLVLSLCCGMFGCGGGGGSSGKSKLEGEWICVHMESNFGGTVLYQAETITLQSGGKLLFRDNAGSWKYSAKEQKIGVEMNGNRGTMRVEERDGRTYLVDNYGDVYFRPDDQCKLCPTACVGTWQQLTNEPDRKVMELKDDGTMTINGQTHQWKSLCSPEQHYLDISDYGIVEVNPEIATVSVFDTIYCKNNEYTFIEITPDNWNEYFSSDFMTNFELEYVVQEQIVGDEWEQKKIQNVSVYAALKDRDLFATGADSKYLYLTDHLVIEYSYEYGTQTFTLDSQGNVIAGAVQQADRRRDTQTTEIYTTHWYDEEEHSLTFSLPLGSGDISQPVSLCLPKKIHRMKGWLAVKDMSKLTAPVEPEPVVDIYPGDICPGQTLPVIGSDATVDPTKTGKVTLLSFWGTYSYIDQADLSLFDQLTAQYADSLSVFAVHSFPDETTLPDPVRDGYTNEKVRFLRDTNGSYFSVISGNLSQAPIFMILDENGLIVERLTYNASHDAIKEAIQKTMQ